MPKRVGGHRGGSWSVDENGTYSGGRGGVGEGHEAAHGTHPPQLIFTLVGFSNIVFDLSYQ